jgi:hypothetical protein
MRRTFCHQSPHVLLSSDFYISGNLPPRFVPDAEETLRFPGLSERGVTLKEKLVERARVTGLKLLADKFA